MAVAAEVSDRHGSDRGAGSVVLGGLEGAIAVAQQHTHSRASCDDEVEMAVCVKIPRCHGPAIKADRVAMGGLKGAVAFAHQDAHLARWFAAGHCEIENGVAVEVSYRDSARTITDSVGLGGL